LRLLIFNIETCRIEEYRNISQLTFEQVIEEISKVTGRDIKFSSITMDEYTKMLKEYQVPEDYIWLINYLFTEVLVDKNSVVTNDIEKVPGRKAKDFADYARETAATGIWNPVASANQ